MAFATEAGSALLTHNRVDFERLHRRWLELGRPHAGIIIVRRRLPAELAGRVGRLLARFFAEDFANRLFYALTWKRLILRVRGAGPVAAISNGARGPAACPLRW